MLFSGRAPIASRWLSEEASGHCSAPELGLCMNKTWRLQLALEGSQSPRINWKMICPLTGFIGAGLPGMGKNGGGASICLGC